YGGGDLGIAEAPAVAFVFSVTEELFDGHPPAIEGTQLRGGAVQVRHQEPAFIAFGRQVLSPADDNVLGDGAIGAIQRVLEHLGDAFEHRVIQQRALESVELDGHLGLDANQVAEAILPAELGQSGASKAPVGQNNDLDRL